MEIFSNKNIRFDTIKTKASSERALKGAFQKRKAFQVDLSVISSFVQKNKEISLAIAIIVGMLLFLNHFIGSKTTLIQSLDKQARSYIAKEKPVKNWQTLEKENKEWLKNFPLPIAESLFLETISALASQQNLLISQYTPVPLTDEGFYYKTSLRLDCETKSFQNLLMFLYEVEQASLALRVEDIKVSTGLDANQKDLNIKLLISLIQLKENYEKAKKN